MSRGPDVVALVMAGGRGTRMRASGIDEPKPLVSVAGVTLLEWNVRMLLRAGLRDVVVSVSPDDRDVAALVAGGLAELAARWGGVVDALVEERPLGNVGAAGLLHAPSRDVLVVFADNFTLLDPRLVLDHHRATGAALTLATHEQPFRIPYGQLTLEGGRVTAYREKPTLPVTVCSAVSVLGPPATATCSPTRPTGLVDLTGALLEAGLAVAAFPHAAPWVDVNDAGGVARAEALAALHREALPPPSPPG